MAIFCNFSSDQTISYQNGFVSFIRKMSPQTPIDAFLSNASIAVKQLQSLEWFDFLVKYENIELETTMDFQIFFRHSLTRINLA